MEANEVIVKKTKEVLGWTGIEVEVESNLNLEIATNYINIVANDARLLIGPGGESLFALEYLLKRMLEKEMGESPKFFLDINGYRLHQIETLKEEVKQMAKKVRLYRKEMVLKPMAPFERRIIHMALAEYPDITTESVGEGERRRVVIKPYP
ncbi:MAG: R3H domain-containing nucleic acid-binding protein [bacterium]|nr:R3H domain-containing nucleic acid-binding protein [bacterium]